jgi:hypothetical protein
MDVLLVVVLLMCLLMWLLLCLVMFKFEEECLAFILECLLTLGSILWHKPHSLRHDRRIHKRRMKMLGQ